MASGQQRGPRRRANRADVELLQFHALALEPVERGRGELVVAMAAEIAPAHVIGEDEKDVGPFCRRIGGVHHSQRREQQGDGDGEEVFHLRLLFRLSVSRRSQVSVFHLAFFASGCGVVGSCGFGPPDPG